MRNWLLTGFVFWSLGLSAGGNLLMNGDFAAGMEGWSGTAKKQLRDAGFRQKVENDRWTATIPDIQPREQAAVLLIHAVSLENRKTYRLSYTLELENAGTMRHLYQLSQRPWSQLGLVENVPVVAGKNEVSAVFTCRRPDPALASHLTLNLSQLTGKVAISNVRLEEMERLAAADLNPSWRVFPDVVPPEAFGTVPTSLSGPGGKTVSPRNAQLANETIDIAKLNGGQFRTRACAMLYNVFHSKGPGVLQLGLSADWWMQVFVNGKPVYSTLPGGNRTQGFTHNDHVVSLPVNEGENVLAVQVLSGSKGWRFVCGTPDPPITYTANEEWKAVDMAQTQTRAGSALDLSSQVPAPAGRFGRVTIGASGSLVFADEPERPLRMHGFNGFPYSIYSATKDEDFRSQVRVFAQAARRQGYCLYRVHGSMDRLLCLGATKDMDIQPKQLDRWDYLLAELKREGIYCHLVVFSFGLYEREANRAKSFEERDMHKLQFYLGGEWERKRFRYGAETLLNHVNPYTGMAWKDDPAIAFVEFYNEQALGLSRMKKTLEHHPDTKAFLEREWRNWLVARHGRTVPAALQAELKGTPLAAAPLPPLYDRKSELANQFAQFRMTIAKNCANWCEGVVRGTGYTGLTTQYNGTKKLAGNAVRWQVSQVADMHAYYRHPAGGWGGVGTSVEQSSSLDDAAGYWRGTNATRLSGRPFIVSEFNHCFWNPYQHEGGLVFGAYSALQGFSALEIHSGPVTLGEPRPKVGSFSCGPSPVVRASEFLSACLFQRGDVAPAKHQVELVVPEQALNSNCMALGAVSTQQSRLALMTGFSVAFPWAKRPERTTEGPTPDLRLLPSGVATVDAQDWVVNVVESKDGTFSLPDTIDQMHQRGILPNGNLSNAEAGVFQSDTGQILMRTQEHLLQVVTPRTEGVTLEAGKSQTLGSLTVRNSSVPACVAVCSVTDAPVAESERLVLIYSTEMVNTDMTVGYDRREMKNTGKPPALMRCGKLDISLGNASADRLAVYALGFDGSRRERLQTVQANKGMLHLKLDTAQLADGPTSFFEFVAE
jgi:hypothetical protein